jgi:hypothetical protein
MCTLRDRAGGQLGLGPPRTTPIPGELLVRETGAGRGRAGGGLAGSGAYLPLLEEQVAAVRPRAPGFLCAHPPAALSRQSSLGHPRRSGPMAQTPDGISCELRGKLWPSRPLGWEETARPQTRGPPSALGDSARGSLCPCEGPVSPSPLHFFLS